MNDDQNTKAEYVSEDELNDIKGVHGEELDTIEKDQTDEELSEKDSKDELRKAIEGNDDNLQDEALEDENN